MKTLIPSISAFLLTATAASAKPVITEVMAQSSHTAGSVNGDWWELTNTGPAAVDLSGYKWDDTPTPTTPSVSIFPSVTIQPGESIIILEEAAANISAWKTAWGLVSTRILDRDQFSAMGGEGFSGLGASGDEINLYDPSGSLVTNIGIGTVVSGLSKSWHRDGTPVNAVNSSPGYDGAYFSTQSPADTGSPGDGKVHFSTSPIRYAKGAYAYTVQTANPSGTVPVVSASGLPAFLTLTPGTGGSAVLASNRALTLADVGDYAISLTATSGSSATVQSYYLTVYNPAPQIILNEYNAVGPAKFLNDGDAATDIDGGAASTDAYFGRVLGNGGDWVEFVVVGGGGPGLTDIRGWKVEIGKNTGSGFIASNTLVLSQHANLKYIPNGTILTFTEKTTAQGGRDTGIAIRNRRTTVGDTWTNIWMGDPSLLTYTDQATNGYTISTGVVVGSAIDNDGTQFRVKNASGQIVFGPAGEGIAPVSGIGSTEIFELEGHPTPLVPSFVVSTSGTQGYSDGASDSTFGLPNQWLNTGSPVTQSYAVYAASQFFQWAESKGLTGNAALAAADPDGDGRSNFHEYAYGGNPTVRDAAYPSGAVSQGPVVSWNYVRRSNDPSIMFGHESSVDLTSWSPVPPSTSTSAPYAGDAAFSRVTVGFSRPVPAPAKWFLRGKAE